MDQAEQFYSKEEFWKSKQKVVTIVRTIQKPLERHIAEAVMIEWALLLHIESSQPRSQDRARQVVMEEREGEDNDGEISRLSPERVLLSKFTRVIRTIM